MYNHLDILKEHFQIIDEVNHTILLEGVLSDIGNKIAESFTKMVNFMRDILAKALAKIRGKTVAVDTKTMNEIKKTQDNANKINSKITQIGTWLKANIKRGIKNRYEQGGIFTLIKDLGTLLMAGVYAVNAFRTYRVIDENTRENNIDTKTSHKILASLIISPVLTIITKLQFLVQVVRSVTIGNVDLTPVDTKILKSCLGGVAKVEKTVVSIGKKAEEFKRKVESTSEAVSNTYNSFVSGGKK